MDRYTRFWLNLYWTLMTELLVSESFYSRTSACRRLYISLQMSIHQLADVYTTYYNILYIIPGVVELYRREGRAPFTEMDEQVLMLWSYFLM